MSNTAVRIGSRIVDCRCATGTEPSSLASCWPAAGSSANAASAWARWRWRNCCGRDRPRPRRPIADPLAPKPPHIAAKAKRVIYLFMAGAPSHLELFDNKPELAKFDGQLPPAELLKGYRAAFINPNSKLLGPKFKFARHGQCGAEISELLPHLAKVADDIAIVKSMVTDAFNHAPGQILMNTGIAAVRPARAWAPGRLYGLGSESQDLPGFVVFSSGKKGPSGGNSNWGSGFLPTVYQGRGVPQQRRSGAVSVEPAGRRSADAARLARAHRAR